MTIQDAIINGLKTEYAWMSDTDCNIICDAFLNNVTKDEMVKLTEIFNLYDDDVEIIGLNINGVAIFTREGFKHALDFDDPPSVFILTHGHILGTDKFLMQMSATTEKPPLFSIVITKYDDCLLSVYNSSVNKLYKNFLEEIDEIY